MKLMRRLSNLAIVTTLLLLISTVAWQLPSTNSAGRWIWCGLVALPVLAVLANLVRKRPGAATWAILVAIPYVMFAVMESIANPLARSWAAASAVIAFVQFTVLACLLRAQSHQRQ